MGLGPLDPTMMIRIRQLAAMKEYEDKLRGLIEPEVGTLPSGNPDVPPPALVRNLGISASRPSLMKMLEQIQQIAPRAGTGVHTISTTPPKSVLDLMTRNGMDPAHFSETNLAGAVPKNEHGRIYINRNASYPSQTLAHELSHSANDTEEPEAYKTGNLWEMLDPPTTMKSMLDNQYSPFNRSIFGDPPSRKRR